MKPADNRFYMQQFPYIMIAALALFMFLNTAFAKDSPGFFRYPDTDGKTVVFTSEGDLWRVPITGGTAVRLTTHEGDERFAHISPDGKLIAFSEQDDGQDDVYYIPVNGGEPQRLTFHPGRDQVIGWTPKGEVLFRSSREIPYRGYRIYTISTDGGFPQAVRLNKAALISYEPNGSRIAFNRYTREFRKWKRYKGGWAQDIWVGDLAKNEFKNVTDNAPVNDWDGTDAFPMWHSNGRIYYLCDRSGRANIHSMKPDGSDMQQHTTHSNFDIRWPSMKGDYIVYQHGMDLWVYNISSNSAKMIPIDLPTDRVQARIKNADPKDYITDFQLSKDGKRLLFCARGELFTVPAKGKGLIRQLTNDSGIREKFPKWSADNENIIFWSDESGEEQLYSIPATGGERKLIGYDGRGWHFPVVPSPDGKSIAFTNENLEVVVMEIKSGDKKFIDIGAWEIRDYVWSPDSRYLVYSRPEENSNNTVRVWDSKSESLHQVTDDFTNSYSPVFDPEGKYLYFLSDRIANPHLDGHEMTYILDKRTLPYALMLKKDTMSPFAPEADPQGDDDEEGWMKGGKDKKDKKGKKGKDKDDEEEKVVVDIDFDGLSQRIVEVPVAPGNYFGLSATKNKIFYLSHRSRGMMGSSMDDDQPRGLKLHSYNLKKQKHKVVFEGIRAYDISADGEKLVVWQRGKFIVQGVNEGGGGGGFGKDGMDKKDDDDDSSVDLSQWDLRVEVRAEWQQMFREAWRFQRDFFWTPDMHMVNWQGVYDQYYPLAERVSTRDELGDLIGEMFAELNCSHTYNWGGDQRHPGNYPTGLLGADLSRDKSGFYRIDRIITARPWDPDLISPLASPGLNIKDGDFIVAVNGQPVSSVRNIYELLLNKAGKIISLNINSKPEMKGAREVIIKPMSQEYQLRYWEWVEGRRAYTAEKSDGQIGYIHLSNMGGQGLSQFTAAYQPQHNKSALILDVRYNGGGFVAEMILAHLGRQLVSIGKPRHGATYRSPQTAFRGHMAAVSNGETGSDGETFTEGFKRLGLGPVIGTRTWGGWVGIRMDKLLVDRGMVSQPEFTGWGMDGNYMIEGWGTDPDMEVKEHPTAELDGMDPQLDATIEYLLKKLKDEPVVLPEAPAYPDRSGFAR